MTEISKEPCRSTASARSLAGFDTLIDDGPNDSRGGKPGYIDGTLMPVPVANKAAFRDWAAKMAALFREYGATRVLDGWVTTSPTARSPTSSAR